MIVQHHVKYKEIDGYDKIRKMDMGQHRKHHLRLRKSNRMKISPKELHDISTNAYRRTKKGKSTRKAYSKENRYTFNFSSFIEGDWRLLEKICFNKKTGNINYFWSGFKLTDRYQSHLNKMTKSTGRNENKIWED